MGMVMGVAVIWTWLGLAAAGLGQAPLDRIEDQIRTQAGQGNAPPAPPSPAEAAVPPVNRSPAPRAKAGEGPYLGAVADDRHDRGRGVRVVEVRPGGPADRGGLRTQDLVVGAANNRVRQMSDLTAVLDLCAPGDKLLLEVVRDGQTRKVEITLGQRVARPGAVVPEAVPAPPAEPGPAPGPSPSEGPLLRPLPSGPSPSGPLSSDATRIEQLQRRVEQLERRVEELERTLAETRRKP
jgi:hypothetical protein